MGCWKKAVASGCLSLTLLVGHFHPMSELGWGQLEKHSQPSSLWVQCQIFALGRGWRREASSPCLGFTLGNKELDVTKNADDTLILERFYSPYLEEKRDWMDKSPLLLAKAAQYGSSFMLNRDSAWRQGWDHGSSLSFLFLTFSRFSWISVYSFALYSQDKFQRF